LRAIALSFIFSIGIAGCASLAPTVASQRAAAHSAYAAGNFAAAAGRYERLVQADLATVEDWFRLGNAYVELDRLVEAAAAFRAVLEREPKHGQARHNLGLVYLQLGVTNLLDARRELPEVDQAAAATVRYLACIMEIFMGRPDPVTCRDQEVE
jgi:tetratricopeptide (TPR) repeat protein